MIRIWLTFLIIFGMFFFGIDYFRLMTGRRRWEILKTAAYSLGCAALTVIVLFGIVILF